MFGRRRRRRHEEAPDEYQWDSEAVDDAEPADDPEEPVDGPFDEAEAPDDGVARLDLGSVRVPMPDGTQLQVEVDPAGPVRAVHLLTEIGRITVSAFAAPRSSGLWHEVSNELADQLRKDGARVRWEHAEWGDEILATSPEVAMRFVGVDGPRWLLRAVGAGPLERAGELAELLHELVRGTVVVRGSDPLPVRSPLPLELPAELAAHIEQAQQAQQAR